MDRVSRSKGKACMVQCSKVGISSRRKGMNDSQICEELQVGLTNSSLVGVRDQTKVDSSSNSNSSRPRATKTCSIRSSR